MRRIRSRERERGRGGIGKTQWMRKICLDGKNGGVKGMSGGRWGIEAFHCGACSSCVTSTAEALTPSTPLSLSFSVCPLNAQLKSVATLNRVRLS